MARRQIRYAVGVLVASIGAGAGILACASAPPIPLRGSPADFAALVGEWNGQYTSRDAGRSGSIWFTLVAGEDHAHGDVLMTARSQSMPYSRYSPGDPRRLEPEPLPQFLTIRFVRVTDGGLHGALEPYWDPACQCEAVTSFHGRLLDGRLRGTFITRLDRGASSGGQWHATRRRIAGR